MISCRQTRSSTIWSPRTASTTRVKSSATGSSTASVMPFFSRPSSRIDAKPQVAAVRCWRPSRPPRKSRVNPDSGLLMIGKTVGKYEITTELGRGGMGTVYEGRDLRLGRSVALKFLHERTAHDRTAVERFFREARAASALNHPNIVTVFDIGEGESGWFIAMELIQGRTLRSLAGAGLSIDRLAEIGAQVAKALSNAHAAGIVAP